MVMRGDLSCLNCGRFLGELEGELSNSLRNAQIRYRPGSPVVSQKGSDLRCGYCGGKAILESLERVRRAA